MISCEQVIEILKIFVVASLKAYNQAQTTFLGISHNIDENDYVSCYTNHHFNRLSDLFDARVNEIDEILYSHQFPRSVSNVFYSIRRVFDYLRTDSFSIIRHHCSRDCPYYTEIPLAQTQGIVWSDTPILSDSEEEDFVETSFSLPNSFSNLSLTEPLNDPAPVYDYPPSYILAVSETKLPLTLIRYGLEVFEMLWDMLLNFTPNTDTMRFDMLDFVAIQTARDAILNDFTTEMTFPQYVDALRQIENLQDHLQWYGSIRLEEYFRRHNRTHIDTTYAFHVGCPACLTHMKHCFRDVQNHNECPVPDLCEREKMKQFFEPQQVMPYSTMYNVLQQRKIFGIQKTFEYYANSGEYVKFDHFVSNLEANMMSAGYVPQERSDIVIGERLDLTFPPQSLCKMDPNQWKQFYSQYFAKFVQEPPQEEFAMLLCVALSGSMRHARLMAIAPKHLRAQLWDGPVPWMFVEPYARRTEPLLTRLILDSIFDAFRQGHTWQLKPQFNSVYDNYRKLDGKWNKVIDTNALSFFSLLNR